MNAKKLRSTVAPTKPFRNKSYSKLPNTYLLQRTNVTYTVTNKVLSVDHNQEIQRKLALLREIDETQQKIEWTAEDVEETLSILNREDEYMEEFEIE